MSSMSDQSAHASAPPTAQPPVRQQPAEIAGPVTKPERITSIDVLRGVALLGILLMNIQAFSMPGAAYMNPHAYGELSGGNYWVWFFTHLLASQKFVSIFSMLFGAGIVLMTSRAEQRTGRSAGVHYRRMMWLIIFGLLHAHLLWYGDILYSYGMCGLILFLFRKVRPRWLITIGLVLLCVPMFANLGFYGLYQVVPEHAQQQWAEGMSASWNPSAEITQEELNTYRGGWLEQMSHRVPMSLSFQTIMFVIWLGWFAGGMMMIGMALYKLGVFSASRSTRLYTTLVAICIPVGLSLSLIQLYLVQTNDWPMLESFHLYSNFHYWGASLQALGYVSLVMLVCKSGILAWLQRALADVGRMALTNYLMQTIICTTIFYGHGFGQYGSFSRVEQLTTVFIIWIVQLIYSPIWLTYFRFGPFEWLWRSLTYWKPQPLVRAKPA